MAKGIVIVILARIDQTGIGGDPGARTPSMIQDPSGRE